MVLHPDNPRAATPIRMGRKAKWPVIDLFLNLSMSHLIHGSS